MEIPYNYLFLRMSLSVFIVLISKCLKVNNVQYRQCYKNAEKKTIKNNNKTKKKQNSSLE